MVVTICTEMAADCCRENNFKSDSDSYVGWWRLWQNLTEYRPVLH